jgi:hypothetical protein
MIGHLGIVAKPAKPAKVQLFRHFQLAKVWRKSGESGGERICLRRHLRHAFAALSPAGTRGIPRVSPLSPVSESARAVPSLAAAIAECLSLHAQALDRLGTDRPELDDRVDPEFRVKVVRQRSNVSASLEGDPELHRRHVEALNKGLSILLRRLAPQPPKPPRPSLPLWDDIAKAWRVPGPRQVDTGNPDRPFNDHIDDLF